MNNNKQYSFEDIAKEIGCSVEELKEKAFENGLIDEYGNPTEMAIKNGFLAKCFTVDDEFGIEKITVSHSNDGLIAVCMSAIGEEYRVAFISRENAHELGKFLISM